MADWITRVASQWGKNPLMDSLLRRRGVELVLQASRALKALHASKPPRVHQDIKPGNLLLFEGDVVEVADFGLVAIDDDDGDGVLGGTRVYVIQRCVPAFVCLYIVCSYGIILFWTCFVRCFNCKCHNFTYHILCCHSTFFVVMTLCVVDFLAFAEQLHTTYTTSQGTCPQSRRCLWHCDGTVEPPVAQDRPNS